MRFGTLTAYLAIAIAFCFVGPQVASRATWVSDIANAPVSFAAMPLAVGILSGTRALRGLLIGLATCVLMVTTFYWADDLSGPQPFNSSGFTTYVGQAVVVGAACGLLGAVIAGLSRVWRLAAALLFAALCMGVELRDVLAPDNRTIFDNLTLLASGLVWAALVVIAARGPARREPPERG